MIQIAGQVFNVYTQEGGKGKDGSDYDSRHKVQLMGEIELPNGDIQFGLMDLTVDDVSGWEGLKGQNIAIDVGAFAPSKGSIIYFVRKGSKPKLMGATHV